MAVEELKALIVEIVDKRLRKWLWRYRACRRASLAGDFWLYSDRLVVVRFCMTTQLRRQSRAIKHISKGSALESLSVGGNLGLEIRQTSKAALKTNLPVCLTLEDIVLQLLARASAQMESREHALPKLGASISLSILVQGLLESRIVLAALFLVCLLSQEWALF